MTSPIAVGNFIVLTSPAFHIEKELDAKYQRVAPGLLKWDTTKPIHTLKEEPKEVPAEVPKVEEVEEEKPKRKRAKKKR